MTDPTVKPGHDSGPVPWDYLRAIDGQPGYVWRYHSPGSDTRDVVRRATDAPENTAGDTVVGNVRLAWIDDGCDGEPDEMRAYDTTGTVLGGVPRAEKSSTGRAAALPAQADRAVLLGTQDGDAGAQFVFGPHRRDKDYADCLRMDAEGDPAWWDRFGPAASPLSGEWADALTPASLMAFLGVARDSDPDGRWEADLCERYEDAFTEAWHERVITTARARLAAAT